MARITVQSHSQKKHSTSVLPDILTEAKALQELYNHHKSMLALMGNVTTFTLNKALGEIGGTCESGAYQKWLRYSKERCCHNMPAGGQTGILGATNKLLGEIWTALPLDHRKVFHPPVFYALSGISHSAVEGSDNEDKEPVQPLVLDPEEQTQLQALYDELVCKERVAQDYAKMAAGIPDGPTLPDYNQKSKRCLECIHTQLCNESKNMDLAYYLLACCTHAATESSSSSPGWFREFTSHNEMALYVNKKSNLGTVFAAWVQGLSVAEVVASTIVGSTMVENPAALLLSKFSKMIGYEHGFPRGPDPESILENKYLLKIIQLPGSKLSKEVLKLGFNGMNGCRKIWLDDVQANLFKMVKLSSAHSDGEHEDDNIRDNSGAEQEVMRTQDIQNNLETDDLMGSEEKWNGLGEDFDEESKLRNLRLILNL
ncbi:uncharacterized protein MELLADRAFT_89741 [Melampsora larici-populina 98AG31]|uniref:Uncharacterized protein n=1 Tax=Melampsora larici-populina (strain 98AG31 / pathotype 3-4-7) TaxID=747676 RepID=F4RUG0_MELLP|nr:uncharacterized protein MELLADRAFT_89741 [Melampsora larici-populina 98AG31]EGG03928.1 hypothetical protein MELLADRAFT_89741 [Melampsora larici-populina 98AG31]